MEQAGHDLNGLWGGAGCDPVAEMRGAVKRFPKGVVVGPITLRLRRGVVTALLGPNGSGKSTTLRMLLGIYEPDEGEVLVCGSRRYARGLAAYVPEETAVYPRLTGWEHLMFYARLYTGSREGARRVAERAAGYSGLSRDELERQVSGYSKGMRRRLLLGLALALETPLLILDEPTSGLDVFSAVRIRDLIRRAAAEGRAVLVTGHNMHEMERVADYVILIGGGRVVAEGEPSRILEEFDARDLEEAFVKAFSARGEGSS